MSKSVILEFIVVVFLIISMGEVFAGDGDVAYSSPYIMVDPETGKLVTVNPGPELKMHGNDMSAAEAASPTDSTLATPPSTDTTPAAGTAQGSNSGLISVAVVGLIFAVIGFAGWRMKRAKIAPLTKASNAEN